MTPIARIPLLGLLLLPLALPAAAQTPLGPASEAATPTTSLSFGQGGGDRMLAFSLFLGAQVDPAYFGSDEMTVGPSFRAALAQLNFAGVRFSNDQAAGDDPYQRQGGFGYGVSVRYVQGRDSSEYDEIRGLDDIDPTLEVGGALGYALPNFEALAEARYGFGGSEAWVGELRAYYVTRPTDRLTVRVGPTALFGSDEYVQTYFGISERESARSGLASYDPDGGLVSAGAEAIATYRLSDRWWLEGAVEWQRFLGDAEDSPIVQDGSSNSTEVRLGVRRSFTLRF